jgi:hypothetical protein
LREPFLCHEENEIRPLDAGAEKAKGDYSKNAGGNLSIKHIV